MLVLNVCIGSGEYWMKRTRQLPRAPPEIIKEPPFKNAESLQAGYFDRGSIHLGICERKGQCKLNFC